MLIGVRLNGKALCAALDACLCTDAEAAAAAAGRLDDPFLQWPSLQQILDAGDEEEEEGNDDGDEGLGDELPSRLSTVAEEGEEAGGADEASPPPGALHPITYGAAELQECFDACASRLGGGGGSGSSSGGGAPPLGVVSWHAVWCEQCHAAAAELRALAGAHPGAAFFQVDLEGSAANTAFALEKVARKPDSRRAGGRRAAVGASGARAAIGVGYRCACLHALQKPTSPCSSSLPFPHAPARAAAGAKLLLKSGERFPCITLHYLPSLQPFATLAGEGALGALRAALAEHAAGAGSTGPTPAAPPAAPAAAAGLVPLRKGAAEFKQALAAARDAAQPVLVVWRSGDAADGAAMAAAAAAAAAAAGGRLVAVDADAAASPSNQVLARALKVAAFPEVHAYRGMQLEAKLAAAQATPAALARLAAQLAGNDGGANGSSSAGPKAAGAAPAVQQQLAPAAAPAPGGGAANGSSGDGSSGGGGVWDPPAGKFAKPGATKRFPDSRLGFFFPKMPCLRWAVVPSLY